MKFIYVLQETYSLHHRKDNITLKERVFFLNIELSGAVS